MRLPTFLMLLVLASCFACQNAAPTAAADNQLGTLNYEFQISPAARAGFNEGLLLLHSFEYDDAREAFQKAYAQDSTEVMVLWGETMTHYKALWKLQDVEAGRAVIAKLGPTEEERMANIDDPLEKDFWQAIEILYGEGDFLERNQAYAQHMASLYEKYEGNQEVAAFYALGLMWSVEGGRDTEVFDLSAKVAASILEENPQHPGALHYMIHANDDPDFAQLAILAANDYDNVAPDAAHALHMPSHIYLALGMWNDMVASNERSYQASLNRMERKGLDDKARGYHSYAWLHYGYLQQGRFEKAAELLKDMQQFVNKTGDHKGARRYLIDMQSAQRAEEGRWSLDVEPMDVSYKGLSLHTIATQHFMSAMMAYDSGDKAAIQAELDTLNEQVKRAKFFVTNESAPMCSAGPTRYAPTKGDVKRAQVMMNQMQAFMAALDKDLAAQEKYLIAATEIEKDCEYSYGPPRITYPSFEQYGEWLLAQNRAEEAIVQFDESLAVGENRAKALQGKMEALKQLGKVEEAEALQKILDGFWKKNLS